MYLGDRCPGQLLAPCARGGPDIPNLEIVCPHEGEAVPGRGDDQTVHQSPALLDGDFCKAGASELSRLGHRPPEQIRRTPRPGRRKTLHIRAPEPKLRVAGEGGRRNWRFDQVAAKEIDAHATCPGGSPAGRGRDRAQLSRNSTLASQLSSIALTPRRAIRREKKLTIVRPMTTRSNPIPA